MARTIVPTEDPDGARAPEGATRPMGPEPAPLREGDRVGHYVVDRYCGHGSFGRTYWAHDLYRRLRVVIKEVREDSPYAAAAGAAEREALTAVLGHSQMVTFLEWVPATRAGRDPDAGPRAAGYLVLEALSGADLAELVDAARDAHGRTRLASVPFLLERVACVLPAVAHLHRRGRAYCDFKPAHIKAADHGDGRGNVKLIDLGAVVRFGRGTGGPWFAGRGFGDPRLGQDGPSVATDVFAIGRTVAVAATGFDASSGAPVPSPADAPVFRLAPSLYRLVRRAVDPDPACRFASVDELAAGLVRVVRELRTVLAERPDPQDVPPPSVHFEAPIAAGFGTGVPLGPLPLDRPADVVVPAGGEVAAALHAPDDARLVDVVRAPQDRQLVGLRSRVIRDRLERGELDAAAHDVDLLGHAEPREWRVPWFRAALALRRGRPADARAHAEEVAGMLPGEIAPLLALAACSELVGDGEEAERNYELVWRGDRRNVTAAFGLARARLARDEGEEAADTLLEVDRGSAHRAAAELGAARALCRARPVADLPADRLARASRLLPAGTSPEALWVRAEFLLLAWAWLGHHGDADVEFLGRPLTVPATRTALTGCLAGLARHHDGAAADELVDLAQSVRVRTWW